MLLFLTLTALSVVTAGSVLAYQRGARARLAEAQGYRALPAHDEEPAEERTLETLRVGDVIVDGDEDWVIVGTCTYQEEQDLWWLHRIDSGSGRRWFEVRRRDGLVASFFDEASDVPSFGQLYDGLTHKGQPYRLVRRGDARVTADGETDEHPSGLLRYATYEGPGGGYLNVDEANGKRVSLTGERVVGEGLMLMPGERPEVQSPLFPPDDEELRA